MTSPPRTPDPPPAPRAASAFTSKIFWPLLALALLVCLAWPRATQLLAAALALAGLFRLSRHVASGGAAWATVLCAALSPALFSHAAHAQRETAAAALALWGLVLYLPPKVRAAEQGADGFDAGGGRASRRAASVALFALAGLASAPALVTPLALSAWETLCRVARRFRLGAARAACLAADRPYTHTLLLPLALAPLLLAWLSYGHGPAEHSAFAPDYLGTDLTGGVGRRLWQVTGHAGLWALTAPAALAMLLPAKEDARGHLRRRIDVRVQLVFAAVVLAHVVAPAGDVTQAVPLVILVCVSTLRRRLRRWPLAVAAVCAVFVAAALSR